MRVASWTNGSSRAAGARRSITRPGVGPFDAHASRAREPHAQPRRSLGRHCAALPWPGRANSRTGVRDVAARGTAGRPISGSRIEEAETRSLVLVLAEPRVRRLSWMRGQSRNATRGEERRRTAGHSGSDQHSERGGVVPVRVPSRSPSESAPGTRGRAACSPPGRVALSGLNGLVCIIRPFTPQRNLIPARRAALSPRSGRACRSLR